MSPNTENSSDIVALRYVVDGNFTAQHMKMRKPEDDVALSDGLAYMVANGPYENHVSRAADNEEVCNICCLSYGFRCGAHSVFLEIVMSKPQGSE